MKNLLFYSIIIAAALFAPQYTGAQNTDPAKNKPSVDDLFSMSLEELLLQPISTGSFLDRSLSNAPLSLTVISAEQLESSGAQHISEALEIFVPGFQYMINKWNGIIWGMRGVASDRNTKFIFLVNGHKMNMESRDGAMSELDLGMLEDVKRIEILRGPAGLVYGSGAIAGVINIITQEYEKDQVTASVKAQTWSMDSYGTEMQASVSHRLSNNATVKVDLGGRKSDGVGRENSRIWGRPSCPYDQSLADHPHRGIPSNGSAGSTPGNFKSAVDFKWERLRIYTRWTHQVTNGSGWFILDPWPEINGKPAQTESDRMVDGEFRSPGSAYGTFDALGNNRRQYVINNISSQAEYTIPLQKNSILLKAGVDAVTDRIQLEDMKGYESQYSKERNTEIFETFGEKRYTVSGKYAYKTSSKYEFAIGDEMSMYDIGNDLSGQNAQSEVSAHLIVSDVRYFYNSVFAEGILHVSHRLDLHAGLRYDLHTRTARFGGVYNPMIGTIYKFSDNHSIKLVFQQSANNGSADNYEFNRYLIGDDGQPFSGDDYHFQYPYVNIPPVIPPVTQDMLHQLKPEKSQSLEMMGFFRVHKNLMVSPSVSYNTISNLFGWNESLFRIVNAGKYSFVNIDLDVQYSGDNISIGANHTMQQLVGMDVKSQEITTTLPAFEGYDSTYVGSSWNYTPRRAKKTDGTDSTVTTVYNYIRDGITVDGENFLNLSTHVSKIYANYAISKWLTLHTSARVFWGMAGRKEVYGFDAATNTNETLAGISAALRTANDFPYLGIVHTPMVKLNAGIILGESDSKVKVSLHAYNLLGGNSSKANLNSIRWQQAYNAATTTDLYGMDYRSYAIKVQYQF